MPYATIDEILRQVPADNPGSPTGFPDFDPEDTKAWAYFVYVYLDASQSDGYGRPCFLPRYGRKAGSGESVWYENVIEWEGGAANPFKEKFTSDYDEMHRIGLIKLIFNYINNLVREWHYGYDGKSDRKMGFYIKNRSREIYNEYLNRVDKARNVAWDKAMKYSAEMLYGHSESYNRGKRKYAVQADTGEAFILPDLALLFFKVNCEWKKVFPWELKITGGYRTKTHQKRVYEKAQEGGTPAAKHSAHVSGTAIDVVPKIRFYRDLDCGTNIILGYLAWLFRRVARRDKTYVHIEYAGNVSRQREESFEINGDKLLAVVPYTLVESGHTLHVSYIWLLRVMGATRNKEKDKKERKELLPPRVRPYSDDLANPEGKEALGPKAFDPLFDSFDERTYKSKLCGGVRQTLGVSANWMKGLIEYVYPTREELVMLAAMIRTLEFYVSTMEKHISILKKDVKEKEREVEELKKELEKLKKGLEYLEGQLSSLKKGSSDEDEIRAIVWDILTIKKHIKETQNQIDKTKGKMKERGEDVEGLKRELEATRKKLESIKDKVEKLKEKLKKRTREIESKREKMSGLVGDRDSVLRGLEGQVNW